MIRVLVADDHSIVCEGLSRVLSSEGDVQVVATAASGPDVFSRLRLAPVDVVLLDLSMPGMGGVEILKHLKAEWPSLPVLVFSMHPEDQYAVRCVKAGAAGYLSKSCDKKVLLDAVRRAAAGGQFITPAVGECLLREVRHPGSSDSPHLLLSDREFEIFLLIADGTPPAEIARRLNLSPKTVSTYRTRILEKTSLSGNSDIMRYAIDHGLVSRPIV